MRVFLYEWATGGGLVDQPGALPESLLCEGAAMLGALAADFVRIEGCHVTVLRDMRVIDLALPGVEIIDVQSKPVHDEHFANQACQADGTMVIAPEFDRILESTAVAVELANGTLWSPPPKFVRLTASKQRTAEKLASADIPVPEAMLLAPEDKPPQDFFYPAVIKPIDGAGSQDTQLVTAPHDEPLPYHEPRRLERYYTGLPVSVAVICGWGVRHFLPPCEQVLSSDGRFRYHGGRLPLPSGMAVRATTLAEQVVSALPYANGYFGIDMILGREADGTEDVVIEVNPRLTTSYVCLRAAAKNHLAAAIVDVHRGQATAFEFSDQPLEFDTKGHVSYL